MFFNENAVKNKIQTYKNRVWDFFDRMIVTKAEREAEEKKLDHEIKESFPASDAPAHRSVSIEDRNQHPGI